MSGKMIRNDLESWNLTVQLLGREFTELDTGEIGSLLRVCYFIETIENWQGYQIACFEDIAFDKGWVNKEYIY